jgi:hypothetical protein
VDEFGLTLGDRPGAAVVDADTAADVAVDADADAVQAYYMEHAALDFVGRKGLLARLQEFADSDVQGYVPARWHPRGHAPDPMRC